MTDRSGEGEQEAWFEPFCSCVDNLYTTWIIWWRLFSTETSSEKNYAVMKLGSETLFRYARWQFLRATILDIAKLCDPPKTRVAGVDRENLTLERVFSKTDFAGRLQLQHKAREAMEEATRLASKREFQLLRNRVIAHNDLLTLIDKVPYPDPAIVDVALVVQYVADFRFRIAAAVQRTHFDYQSGEGLGPPGEATKTIYDEMDRLLQILERGAMSG